MKKLLLNLTFVLAIVGVGDLRAAEPVFGNDLRETVATLPAVASATGIELADLQGKPVIVSFFASWCPPCLVEFNHINKLHSLYETSDMAFVAINVFEEWDENDAARMATFLERTQPQFPVVAGNEEVRDRFGGIDRIPTVYGFSADGTLSYEFIHQRNALKTNASFEELDKAVKLLLAQ